MKKGVIIPLIIFSNIFIVFLYYKFNRFSEINMNVSEMIIFHGYPVEDHEVETDDGYILSLQRIPHGRNHLKFQHKPAVLLQHGLLDSACTWIINGPRKSLGYILADLGYDVWLGNSRGNTYSRRHKTLDENSRAFWNFTWDEMAEYDFPAMVEYILSITNEAKLTYVGHSQGTEIAFAKLSKKSMLNTKISSFAALAPAVYLGHLRSGARELVEIAEPMNAEIQLRNHGEIFENLAMMNLVFQSVCDIYPDVPSCSDDITGIGKIDITNLDEKKLPIYHSHTPAGTSSKNLVHYAQSIKSNKFQMYDYGKMGNLEKYKNETPPIYDLSSFNVPVGIFYGNVDIDTTPEDVNRTIKELGKSVVYTKFIQNYRHIDLLWSKTVAKDVYKYLVEFIKRYQ